MSHRPELVHRAQQYASQKGLVLAKPLGSGVHGSVFTAKNQTNTAKSAIKVHERERDFQRERDVYIRLQGLGVTDVCGCAVPELLAFDNELWILEMTVVTPSFVLDFGDANLDQPHDFSEEVLADWRADKQELFDRRWPEVLTILRYLEGYGIYMLDVHPGNISFDE